MPPSNRPTATEKAITTAVRLIVSRWFGQATLRSSERTSRMKSSGLPRPPRRPPAPASAGIGARAGAAVDAAPPRRSRFSPTRAGLVWGLLVVWATAGASFQGIRGALTRTRLGPSASQFYHAEREPL